jgi:hypothetical protein
VAEHRIRHSRSRKVFIPAGYANHSPLAASPRESLTIPGAISIPSQLLQESEIIIISSLPLETSQLHATPQLTFGSLNLSGILVISSPVAGVTIHVTQLQESAKKSDQSALEATDLPALPPISSHILSRQRQDRSA